MSATATDLFAGAGGSSEGLTQAGVRVLAAANHWPTSVATHSRNHPTTDHYTANLHEVDFRVFPTTDILWASPSCVWHARAGGRKRPPAEVELLRQDQGSIDRATAFAVIQATEVHRYPVVIVENVREFTGWELFDWWLQGMNALGYKGQQVVLNAADFGVPQNRLRWFAVFTRHGNVNLDHTPVRVPSSSILDQSVEWRPYDKAMYIDPQVQSIDTPGVHAVMWRKNFRTHHVDARPFATVTAGGRQHGVARKTPAGHEWRYLTVRELARLQGFPDSYEFEGTDAQIRKQIGNAVPVPVARFLAERALS